MLNEKLNFIEYIYESIPHKYIDNKPLFIYKKDKKWSYGPCFEQLVEIESAEALLLEIESKHYDVDRLELYVDDIILNHCIVMKQTLKKAMKFVTDEQITKKEEAWKKMMNSMMEMFEKDFNSEPKPSLKIVD